MRMPRQTVPCHARNTCLSKHPLFIDDVLVFCSDMTSRVTQPSSSPDCASAQALQGAGLIVALLNDIARESTTVHETSRALSRPWPLARAIEHAIETSRREDACTLLALQIAGLQRIVVEFDRDIAGAEVGSLAELGLRAQTFAILLSINDISVAVRCRSLDAQGFPTGRFRTVDDLLWFVLDSLGAINKLWLQCCPGPQGPARSTLTDCSTTATMLYLKGIEQAQLALAELRTDDDLSAFLRTGAASAELRVRDACARISDLLHISLACEVDPTILHGALLTAVPAEPVCVRSAALRQRSQRFLE